jgi:hypothetical protein
MKKMDFYGHSISKNKNYVNKRASFFTTSNEMCKIFSKEGKKYKEMLMTEVLTFNK